MLAFKNISFEDFLENIRRYIYLIGYKLAGDDEELLLIVINQEVEKIKNECNLSYIPDGLIEYLKKRIAGNFLNIKFLTNSLGDNFDFTNAVKTITEGDVSYTFEVGISASEKFKIILDNLNNGNEAEIICYRQLKW